MHRRDFLKTAVMGAAAAMAGLPTVTIASNETPPLARKVPRWRGFNLTEKISTERSQPFAETDFQWMADWDFDFVRLPLDYRCWTDLEQPYKLVEQELGEIDQAIEFGRKYGVHVCLNLHRAPGYTVAKPPEKRDLWTDEEAQKQFDFQWSKFARRYRGIPSRRLSFNLVNEPAHITAGKCCPVIRRVVAAIRREDPGRLIIADGLEYGREPLFDLADLGIAQSTHGYDPPYLSHYRATWIESDGWPKPTWPLRRGDELFDRQWLRRERIDPWKKLESKGVGVHVGEWGADNKTPHEVVLAWAGDLLGLYKEAGWGWALWNFRGPFGILDSRRADVAYEDFRGHKLDRKLLALLQKF